MSVMPPKHTRTHEKAVILCGLLCLFVATISGCSFLTPGFDVRQATEARADTKWTNETNEKTGEPSGIFISENTTHNRKLATIEASQGTGEVEFYESGSVRTIRGVEAAMVQQSDPADAATVYGKLAVENAKLAVELASVVKEALPAVLNRFGGGAGGAADTPGIGDLIRAEIAASIPAIANELRRQAGLPEREQTSGGAPDATANAPVAIVNPLATRPATTEP